MRKLFYVLMCLTLVACGSEKAANISSDTSTKATSSSVKMSAQSIIAQMETGDYREGEALVRFKSGIKAASFAAVHKAIGASVVRKYTIIPNLEQVKLPQGLSVKDAVMQYMADPNVEYAGPNYIRKTEIIIPNDTYFANQWALRNTGQYAYGTAGADIRMAEGWDVTIGSGDIVIAVLDTGIDYSHNDLVWNVWRNLGETSCTDAIDNDGNGFKDDCKGWDFVNADNDPMDDSGHGTHVAGVIGAKGNNSTGIAGIMWLSNMMALKVCDANGSCDVGAEIAAIDYAIDMKNNHGVNVRVMNASFGGGASEPNEYMAIDRANVAGILFVAAAGNGGDDGIGDNNDAAPVYPASYDLPNIISVAATDQDDRRVSFSNYGPTTVDVAAPGTYIFSTVPNWWTMYYGYGHLEMFSGTSMAAPHVTGLAGLLSAYYSHFTHSQIRTMILRYVDVLPTLNGWILTGGRINADRALKSLWAPTDFVATLTSPSQISLTWTERATDETGYRLERRIEGGSYSVIAPSLPANTNSYPDSGLTDGTKYYYRAKAYNDIGDSPAYQTNEISAVTPLSPPTGLTVTALSSSSASLSWTDHSQSEAGYKIERRLSDGAFVEIGQVGQNVTTFSNSGLSADTTYWYRVRAFNSVAGNSAYSEEVSVKTLSGEVHHHGGGGGGCSIGARQNAPTAFADAAIMLLPLLVIAILRRRR